MVVIGESFVFRQTKGNVVKKIEPLRNSRKSQTATDKKPISLTEHRMKDLSLELAISKNYSVPLIGNTLELIFSFSYLRDSSHSHHYPAFSFLSGLYTVFW